MFPWLDIFLTGIIIRATVLGYVSGPRKALLKIGGLISSLLLPLPFAANCAGHLRSLVEPVFLDSICNKVAAVSSGQVQWGYLGPWQAILTVPVGSGVSELDQILNLALNLTGLLLLIIVLGLTFKILQKETPAIPNKASALIGFGQGSLTVMSIIALAPVFTLAESGMVLSTAIERSVVVKMFLPVLRKLAIGIAPFILTGGGELFITPGILLN